MPNDTKSSEEIEREIERERDGLKTSINDLQDRLSFDGVIQQVGDQFREHGGDFGRSIAQSARDNPVALGLTGIGVAWLMFGGGRSQSGKGAQARISHGEDHADVPDYAARRGASYAGPKTAASRGAAQPQWARAWDRDELGHGRGSSGPSLGERASDAGHAVKSGAAGARDAVTSGAASAKGSAKGAAHSVADSARDASHGVSDTVGGAASSVRDTAGNIWSSASHRADTLQRRLSEGTEHLSEEARERVAAARARALDARDRMARNVSRGTDRAADFYDDHPLAIGALAFALGAAVAGALPRTRTEDEYVGSYSDDLYDEAERIYAEEVEKAQKVVEAGVEEAKNVASELSDDAEAAADSVTEKVKSAGTRVADAAKDKADEENLGDVEDDARKDS